MKQNRKYILLFGVIAVILVVAIVIVFSRPSNKKIESWNVKDYEALEDIISIKEVEEDYYDDIRTYKIMYHSDDCEVASYLCIPNECLENQETLPCLIYNRGGNTHRLGVNHPATIATLSSVQKTVVFATQYRGVDGGTGIEEFGGAEIHDVIKLIDFCEEFAFVDSEKLYMMGESRGGMTTYQAIRQDDRIKKAIVVSGVADAFMGYEDRPDMAKNVFIPLVGGTPEELPEEYEKRSATYWADELKCPVLIIHSKLDEKVSFAQAEKMVQCLEEAGKEYKFVTYDDDYHGIRPEYREIIQEWLS